MKKNVVLLSLLLISVLSVNATEVKNVQDVNSAQAVQQIRIQREKAFEKRLELTEAQKLKAREIRKSGHEKIKPIILEIRKKKQEAEMVRRSRMAVQMQEEKLAAIDVELKFLEKKANDIRRANMKEFESILTRQQKRILKNMKKEGRKNYHTNHPPKSPFAIKK